MSETFLAGLILVLAGGMAQGAFMAPMKWIRGWSWENGWLVFSLTAYLAVPWMLALLTIPRLFEIYSGASAGALLSVCFFGCAWGIGAVTFGLGADALGMALGFAIILGVATTVGTLIPLVTAGSDLVSPKQLLLICLCLAILLLGVWVCSRAGKWKEGGQQKAIGYRRGVMICVASGVLSACGNLGFSFAGSITTRALNLGVPEFLAPNAVWTLLTVPLFLCNCGYALYRLGRFGSGASFRSGYAVRNVTLAIAMGALWMGGLSLYGSGTRKLGPLGTSLGFAIFMSATVIMASVIGLATGEWREAPRGAKAQMGFGIALLVVAICCLATLNGTV
jgi:L-rhamnose-H+ transport protein